MTLETEIKVRYKLIFSSIKLKISLLEHYIHQLSVIVFGGHNNLFTLSILGIIRINLRGLNNVSRFSILVINSVWAGLYLVYHYLNIIKNTSNMSNETQSYSSSYPIPTFIYIYSLALTGPSIFPYLKNPLLRSFAKKLIKCYFTGILTALSSFCIIRYSRKTKKHSEKKHQKSETQTSDNKSDQTISCQKSSFDVKIHIKVCPM